MQFTAKNLINFKVCEVNFTNQGGKFSELMTKENSNF